MDPVYRWLASRSIAGYFGPQVAKPALNNLPFDIFLAIVGFLLPQDIIALRKVRVNHDLDILGFPLNSIWIDL